MKILKKVLITVLTVVVVMCPLLTTQVSAANVKVTKVTLNAATINWTVGKSGSFKPTVTPENATNKTLKWVSSNTKVATVSQAGKLTAVGAGTAVITCSSTDGSNKSAKCTVTVTAVKVTKVTLNAATIKWYVGKSGSFKPTVTPENATNKTLKWVSSNTKVATVSQAGKLTAVGAGTAVITCSSTDGSNKSAKCNVTVTAKKYITSVKLNRSSAYLNPGKALSLAATVAPTDASVKTVKWESSDATVATVSGAGVVTAVDFGEATITCTAADGSGKKAVCKISVTDKKYVESVKLNVSALNWTAGKSGTFTATVLPEDAENKKVKWSTSNSDVAIISQTGFIKVLKAGTATITCAATDGSGAKATCKVTVTKSTNNVSEYTGAGYLGYNYDKYEKCFFTVNNSWQRNFGFTQEYDLAAPVGTMPYLTERLKFEYDGKDWMIQLWKGTYGPNIGCEIGVYNKPKSRLNDFYDCVTDAERLYMDSVLYIEHYDNDSNVNTKRLFVRPYDVSWWQTGFVPGIIGSNYQEIDSLRKFYKNNPASILITNTFGHIQLLDTLAFVVPGDGFEERFTHLIMNSTITFPTYEMMNAFLDSLESQDINITYWICGKSISFSWR